MKIEELEIIKAAGVIDSMLRLSSGDYQEKYRSIQVQVFNGEVSFKVYTPWDRSYVYDNLDEAIASVTWESI